MSFFGAAWSEPVLLRLAYGFEKTTKARRPPRMLKTVEFG
jgi:amidase